MKKVSVIVPVYNAEEYMRRCMESLVNQSMAEDLEIITVNDGSSDGSAGIIREYYEKYPHMIKPLEKSNGGAASARNMGMRHALGEYIAFLDSDDWVEPDMYEKMYALSDGGKKKIIECSFLTEENGKARPDKARARGTLEEYLVSAWTAPWNRLYKRKWLEDIGVYFPEGLTSEDVYFVVCVVSRLESMDEAAFTDAAYIHYVQRSSSVSNAPSMRIADVCEVFDRAAEYMKNNGLWERFAKELEYKYIRMTLFARTVLKVLPIRDKELKRKLLEKFWTNASEKWGGWKKNPYLRKLSPPNIYLRLLTKQLYYLFGI